MVTINTTGTGALVVFSSASNFLNNVTLNGTLDMTSIGNSRQRLSNGVTINGAVNIATGGILSLDSANSAGGVLTVGGTGSINLNDPGARLAVGGTGATTLAAGLTVRGQGNIGQAINTGGNATLVNNAVTLADGGTLNLNTQNLIIRNDHTSAQWGSGNSFNRRADVSGTGQILAGGNTAQAITGSKVSNGASNNATLTISNVRVGTTSFDYQVANTGTTRPTLRGAIQTNVNGANISDSRLVGQRVAELRHGAGGPGGDAEPGGAQHRQRQRGLRGRPACQFRQQQRHGCGLDRRQRQPDRHHRRQQQQCRQRQHGGQRQHQCGRHGQWQHRRQLHQRWCCGRRQQRPGHARRR